MWVSSLSGWGGAGDRCLQLIDEGFILCGRNWQYDISLTKTDINGQVTTTDKCVIHNIDYKLSNYPNPFNPITTINFELPFNIANPILEIFNIKGQFVESFTLNENQNSMQWNAEDYSSGIYLYHIKSDKQIFATRKMVLLK